MSADELAGRRLAWPRWGSAGDRGLRLTGDCRSAALVGRNGCIDWPCWPRFDSGACLAALLGGSEHGRWSIAPAAAVVGTFRSYRGDTLVLETIFETADGAVAVIDFMPPDQSASSVIRIVEGRRGRVPVRMDLTLRFDYGSSVPWVSRLADRSGIQAIAGPNLAVLRSSVALHGEGLATVADFILDEGETATFVLTYGLSHRPAPEALDTRAAVAAAEAWWTAWARRCTHQGLRRAALLRSLLTLKALTFTETGACSPHRRPRCPSSSAAPATGTIAIAGCATPRSRSPR